MKRVFAALLALLLIVPILPAARAEETAQLPLSLTQQEVLDRFAELQTQFPHGTFWNRPVGKAYKNGKGRAVREVYESVTNHRCDGRNYTCKGMCVGFAWMMADLIYRGESTATNHTTPGYTKLTDPSAVAELEPGDIISVRSSSLHHEAIVRKVEDGKVYVAECWGSSRSGCKLNWNLHFNGNRRYDTWYAIRKAFPKKGNLVIYRHPPYRDPSEDPVVEELPPLAQPSAQSVLIDGERTVDFRMYALVDGSGNVTNYISVRDLAAALSGTEAQFEVAWNGSVQLLPGLPYTPPDDDPAAEPPQGPQPYIADCAPLLVDDRSVEASSLTITDDQGGGHTYVKLRDLAACLGYTAGWTAESGVTLDTNFG